MAIDRDTVVKVARLARIAVSEPEVEELRGELSTILGFVAQLDEVDVEGVDPMTAVVHIPMKSRDDVVTEGGQAEKVLANAPVCEGPFFAVPKVVE